MRATARTATTTGAAMSEGEPVKRGEVNWKLLQGFAVRPHKHLNIVDDGEYGVMVDGVFDAGCHGIGEVMQEARTVQHLCDLAGIPEGRGDSAHVDARVYLVIQRLLERGERLERIASWHSRESGGGGTVGSFCVDCGHVWPCDTRKMADGTWTEGDDEAMGAAFEGMGS